MAAPDPDTLGGSGESRGNGRDSATLLELCWAFWACSHFALGEEGSPPSVGEERRAGAAAPLAGHTQGGRETGLTLLGDAALSLF